VVKRAREGTHGQWLEGLEIQAPPHPPCATEGGGHVFPLATPASSVYPIWTVRD